MACLVGLMDCQLAFDNAHKLATVCAGIATVYFAAKTFSFNRDQAEYREAQDADRALSAYLRYFAIVASIDEAEEGEKFVFQRELLDHVETMSHQLQRINPDEKERSMIRFLIEDFRVQSKCWPVAEWRNFVEKTPLAVRYLRIFLHQRQELLDGLTRRTKEAELLEQLPSIVYQMCRRRRLSRR